MDWLEQALGTFERVADIGLRGYETVKTARFNADTRDFQREMKLLQMRNNVGTPQVPDPVAYAPTPRVQQIGLGVGPINPTLLLIGAGALALVLIARR